MKSLKRWVNLKKNSIMKSKQKEDFLPLFFIEKIQKSRTIINRMQVVNKTAHYK